MAARWLILGLVVCAVGNASEINLHGSNTIGAKLAPELVRGWLESSGYTITVDERTAPQEQLIRAQALNKDDVTVRIRAHGSSTGIRDLAEKATHVALSSRPLRAKERREFKQTLGFHSIQDEYVLGLDGIAIIVHPDNPISELSIEQVQDIFSGRFRNWSQLSQREGPIRIFARDDKSGTYDTFSNLVLGNKSLVAGAARFESNRDLSERVFSDRNSIGFVPLPFVRGNKSLAIESGAVTIKPSSFSISTEDYPLSRRLYAYVSKDSRTSKVEQFLQYTQSREGQQVVKEEGFVSQEIYLQSVEVPPAAPEDYREFVANAQRLSVNLRFAEGEAMLDSKAESDLYRIKDFLLQPEYRRSKVMLMGFADASEAAPVIALQLSNNRVDYIARRFIKHGIAPTRARGFGQQMPLADGNGSSTRQQNRRVEIWLHTNASSESRRRCMLRHIASAYAIPVIVFARRRQTPNEAVN